MEIKIGTRGSKLALAQAESVRKALAVSFPMHTFSLKIISTKGDEVQDKPLHEIGGNGLFTTAIEKELLDGKIRLAVHSMKDLPAKIQDEFELIFCPKREDNRDALVLREAKSLQDLRKGAVIATGSIRRKRELLSLRPDLQVVGIRGNVDTRLRRMEEEKLDGMILAAAGLHRLGLSERITEYFSYEDMIPAPAQGALGLEIVSHDKEMKKMISTLVDNTSREEVLAERTFLTEMGADCHAAIGACCKATKQGYRMLALYGRENEKDVYRADVTADSPVGAAHMAVKCIRERLPGRVSLVGAGPGNPELLTLLGKRRLGEADCVLYDRLIAPELLSYIPEHCEKIYVGKENRNHSMEQEEINQLLLRMAMKYKHVVRLKGGDPYVFGRGSEEAGFLHEKNVTVEVVPGISSALAGGTYAGIPATHRGVSGGFHVVTAHNKKDCLADIDFSAMARGKDTCIFLMGLSKLQEIADGLLNAGMAEDMPVSVVSHATTKSQRTVTASLSEIAEKVEAEKITSPAIIIVGAVNSLRDRLNFYENRPLFGKKCLVPRIGDEENYLCHKLRDLGADVVSCKVGEISYLDVDFDVAELSRVKQIIFTSRHAVIGFFRNLMRCGLDVRKLAGIQIAVVGKRTGAELAKYGVSADIMPNVSTGRELCNTLIQENSLSDKNGQVWYIKGETADTSCFEKLQSYCQLEMITVYDNKPVSAFDCGNWEEYDYVFLTCGSSGERLAAKMGNKGKESCRIISIGPECTKRLRECGLTEWKQAKKPGLQEMIDCCLSKEARD